MRLTNLILCLIVVVVLLSTNVSRAAEKTERVGDVLQLLVPAVAYGITHYVNDRDGRMQFTKSFLVTAATTHALKKGINAERPNGGGRSFPSGHTSAAFQGAAFIHARYGLEYAVPAYVAAAFVGYSRVHAGKHHVNDVIAGAALGVATSFCFSPERFEFAQGSLFPYADADGFGIVWTRFLD